MRIKKVYIILLITGIIVSSINVYNSFNKKKNHLHELKYSIKELETENNNLKTRLEFALKSRNIHFESKYVLFFPNNACSSCLEKFLLLLNQNSLVWQNTIIYFEGECKLELIEYLKDAYNLELCYKTLGSELRFNISDLIFFKIENKFISDILLFNESNIEISKKFISTL